MLLVGADHLVLDNGLMCFPLGKTISHIPRIPWLPVVLRAGHGIFPVHFSISIIAQLTFGQSSW